MKNQLVLACVVSSAAAIILAVAALLSIPGLVQRELDRREAELVGEVAPMLSELLADLGEPATPPPRRIVDIVRPIVRILDSIDE